MSSGQKYTACTPEQEARCREHGPLRKLHDALGEAALCRETMREERDLTLDTLRELHQQIRDLRAEQDRLLSEARNAREVLEWMKKHIQPTDEERRGLCGRDDGTVLLSVVREYARRIGVEL